MKLSREEEKLVDRVFKEEVWGESADDDALEKRNAELRDLHQRGQNALKQAEKASHRGDLAAAKKWTDVSQQMIVAFRRLDEMALPSAEEDEEALRAEIRGRLAKYVEQDNGLSRWQMRLEMWEEMSAEATRTGAPQPPPMPPRPESWIDRLPEDLRRKIEEEEEG